ncbi:AfsR/SARP family transcriptional regulator [Actinophytocola sp.]|uniref:AfsR/SARP family transcriptional regulator n=1 Tax=Actinophytocola sp. TaxID=1872138 RepID=UPI002ECFD505
MRYRLLRRVEFWRERKVDLGGAKQRALLATLLFGANEYQSIDHIAESLWEGDRPRSAENLIRVYVHQLRKKLGAAGADVVTEPGGYAIRVADTDLDLWVFERETSQARRAMADGDFARAAAGFRAALALWGEPLGACVDSPLLERVHGSRLADMRLSAVEDLAETELALGGSADLADRLRSLVDQNPYRERLLGLYMLALNKCGRKVEALAAFRRARAALVAEMGVEPGRDLHTLVRDILVDGADAEPDGAPPDGRSRGVVPHQVPPGAVDLIGRHTQVRAIRGFLAAAGDTTHTSARTLLITGAPGVGKSAVMLGAVRTSRHAFPDGELYADLAETSVHQAQEDFLLALGVADAATNPARRQALYRSVTATHRLLVILDNVATESQVALLTPTSPGSALLAASDSRLSALEFTRILRIGGLDRADGLRLLERHLGRRRVDGDRRAAERIVALCDGSPLALHIAGTRLALRPELRLTEFVGQLADENRRLGEFRVGELDLRVRYQHSYDRLDAHEQAVFRCLALAEPAGATVDTLAGDTGLSSPTVDIAVDRLVSAHLVAPAGRDGAGRPRYRQPMLVRDFARGLCPRHPLGAPRCA